MWAGKKGEGLMEMRKGKGKGRKTKKKKTNVSVARCMVCDGKLILSYVTECRSRVSGLGQAC